MLNVKTRLLAACVMTMLLLITCHNIHFAQTPAKTLVSENIEQQQIHQAFEAMSKEEYAKAVRLLESILQSPNLITTKGKINLKNALAHALSKQNQFTKAIELYKETLTLQNSEKPLDYASLGSIYHNLGFTYQQNGQFVEAEKAFFKAIDQFIQVKDTAHIENSLQGLLFISNQYQTQGKPVEAIERLNNLCEKMSKLPLKPSNDDWNRQIVLQRGLLRHKQQDYPNALNDLELVYTLSHQYKQYPASLWGYVLSELGSTNYFLGRYPQALSIYQEALIYNKDHAVFNRDELGFINRQVSELSLIDQQDNYIYLQGERIGRWSDHTKTITVYINAGEKVKGWKPELVTLVKQAFEEWKAALKQRIDFVYTNNPKKTDVSLFWSTRDPKKARQPVTELGLNVTQTWGEYLAKSDIHLYLDDGQGNALNENRFYETILHEIGHMLGIHVHSNHPNDVMFKRVRSDSSTPVHLSNRDITTIQALYRLKPNFSNPQGIYLSEFEKFRKKQMADLDCDDAPVIVLDFEKPGAYGGSPSSKLVCRKKPRPVDQIPIWMPMRF